MREEYKRCWLYIGQEEESHARGAYRCAVCGRNGTADPLDKHHIFGGALRKKSEKYDLTVYLCHSRCHEFGPRAAHRCRETAQLLHEYGQRKAMAEQGWTTEEFVLEFGKNYLPAEEAWGQSTSLADARRPTKVNCRGAERETESPLSLSGHPPLKVNCREAAREAGLGHSRGAREEAREGFCVLDDEGVDLAGTLAAFACV